MPGSTSYRGLRAWAGWWYACGFTWLGKTEENFAWKLSNVPRSRVKFRTDLARLVCFECLERFDGVYIVMSAYTLLDSSYGVLSACLITRLAQRTNAAWLFTNGQAFGPFYCPHQIVFLILIGRNTPPTTKDNDSSNPAHIGGASRSAETCSSHLIIPRDQDAKNLLASDYLATENLSLHLGGSLSRSPWLLRRWPARRALRHNKSTTKQDRRLVNIVVLITRCSSVSISPHSS